jgi:hypothetical protein
MTFSLFDVAFVGSLTPPSAFDFLNPANIGLPVGGGYFAGLISHTANGNPTHALIVAPRATVYAILAWKTNDNPTAGTNSDFNGAANTAAMVTAGIASHPAANFCVNLSIGGFADWYLPARYELDIAYFNLKPTTAANNTSWGVNIYSVPRRNSNNTANNPSQTTLAAFNTSAEAFDAVIHWSSTNVISQTQFAWDVNFANGAQNFNMRVASLRVRAFRRIAL